MDELNSAMNMVGRGVLDGSTYKMNMTDSGFEFGADCVDDIKVRLTWSGGAGLLGTIVDGDTENMITVYVETGSNNVTIPTALSKGKHDIRIVKLNEFQQNSVSVTQVTINGKLTEKPKQKDLKIEFYGDSITCGYGNLSEDHTSPYSQGFNRLEDGYKTYAAYAATELNAEFSVCAWSGCGINHAYGGSTTQLIGSVWNYALYKDEKVEWDFTKFDADIVVINMGTNDYSYAKNSGVAATYDDLKTGCQTLINNIRSKNPDCKIVWIGGMNGSFNGTLCPLGTVLTDMAAADASLWYKGDFYTGQNGGDWHPSASDHKIVGAKVAAYLRDTVGLN